MAVITGISSITYIAAGAAVVFFALSMYLMNRQTKMNQYANLVSIMVDCGSRPMGMLVDRAGTIIPFVSEPNEKNKGLIESEFVIVNPDLIKSNTKRASRLRIRGGPEIVMYPLPYYFPMDLHTSAALCQLARKVRNHPDFSWIGNERRVLELLFNTTDTFEADCRTLITSSIAMHNVVPKAFFDEIIEEEKEVEEEEGKEETVVADVSEEIEEPEADEHKSLFSKLRNRKH